MDGKNQQKNRKAECISVHVPADWKAKLQKIAFDEDRSVNYLVKKALTMYLDKQHGVRVKQ